MVAVLVKVEVAVVSNWIIPLLWVKVPLLVKFEAIVVVAAFEAEKVSPEPMVQEPLMSTTGSKVLTSIVALPVPPMVRLLLTVIVWPVVVPIKKVGVEDVGLMSKL